MATPSGRAPTLRILIVAEHASFRFGGEAALPLHYFRVLRRRGIPTWLVVHARTREELQTVFPRDSDRICYVSDTTLHRCLWQIGRLLPSRLATFSTDFAIHCATQLAQRQIVRRLIREESITIVHEPIPVSPREPSMMYGLGVPVIIGPMNGGMNYPSGLRHERSFAERLLVPLGRRLATVMNWLIPGKRRAAILLVANERTRAALPPGVCHHVYKLVENGVDLALWNTLPQEELRGATQITRFVFLGRLVDWKAVDILLVAFKRAAMHAPVHLSIIGDGVERTSLERLAHKLDLVDDGGSVSVGKCHFFGWLKQSECAAELRACQALVLPSLLECGGAVVLEAMAMGMPVIATAWGGPVDYLDKACGILVEPSSREQFIENLTNALVRIAQNPDERVRMGNAGRQKVVREFDWEVKIDRMLGFYHAAISRFITEPTETATR